MNQSIVITDHFSSFPRDLIPLAIRIQRVVKPNTDLGSLQIFSKKNVLEYVKTESADLFPKASNSGSQVAYIALGFWEAVTCKVSANLACEGLIWLAQSLSRKGWGIRFVLPVVRSKALPKSSKLVFSKLHKTIRSLCEEYETAPLLAPLEATDLVSYSSSSIEEFSRVIGSDMALRVVKKVVQDLDRVERVVKPKRKRLVITETTPVPKKIKQKVSTTKTDNLIIITEEAPTRRKRTKRKEAI